MKIKDALAAVHREVGGSPPKLKDSARLTGSVLVLLTEHRSDAFPVETGAGIQITRRLTTFVGETAVTGTIISSTIKRGNING